MPNDSKLAEFEIEMKLAAAEDYISLSFVPFTKYEMPKKGSSAERCGDCGACNLISWKRETLQVSFYRPRVSFTFVVGFSGN